ncbi:MAG: transglutaminase family protein [bacterium]
MQLGKVIVSIALSSLILTLIFGTIAFGEGIDLKSQLAELEQQGQFTAAKQVVQDEIAKGTLSDAEKKELLWEIERLNRIQKDYSLTRVDLLAALKTRIANFSPEEFTNWEQEKKFDSKVIDGKTYYFGASVSNLIWRYPEIAVREIGPTTDKYDKSVWKEYQKIRKEAEEHPFDRYIYPKTYKVKMTISTESTAIPAGKIVKCWMPYPTNRPQQQELHFLKSSPVPKWIGEPDQDMRAIYFEQVAEKDKPVVFELEYKFKVYSVYSRIDPNKVVPYPQGNPAIDKYLEEQPPHVMFIPEFDQISKEIIGNETNPYLKAKKIYDWIGNNIKYSYAHEYCTIRNISKTTFMRRYGDCGEEAMLFITLCRMNGIPARWQTSWTMYPVRESSGMHDWAEIYLAPYGWVPVDPHRSIHFTRYAKGLTDDQKKELHDFYFGNMDPFRLVANKDHGIPLFPPKNAVRSDTVDFQRGELEYDDVNLYYGQFSYKMDIRPILW